MSKILPSVKHICAICRATYSAGRKKQTYQRWYDCPIELSQGSRDAKICNKCYFKFIYNDKRDRRDYQKWIKTRTISFKHLRLILTFKIRSGYCSKCSNNIFDETCKRTHSHHAQGYYIIFPWYGVIELCPSCHKKHEKNKEVEPS